MTFFELFLIGIGLSMDAFAVSICKGLSMQKIDKKYTLCIGLFFGGFQALMPLLGWLLGTRFQGLITSVDHWIAFGLLAFIGGKMIWEAVRGGEEEQPQELDLKMLLMMAVATSIDALAVGVSFAFLSVNIGAAVSFIGVITFVLSMVGVKVGSLFGAKYKSKAELAGGVILILMGLKILLEHLGVLG